MFRLTSPAPLPPAGPSSWLYRSVAQSGSALGSGPRGRGFNSLHSDHIEAKVEGTATKRNAVNAIVIDREAGTT